MNVTIAAPVLPKELEQQSFEEKFDNEDPYIEYAYFKNDVLTLQDKKNVEFRSVRFEKVRFIGTSLSHAYFRDCIFDHCELVNIELTESALKRVLFKECRMNGASFAESFLEDVQFEDSMMNLAAFGYAKQKRVGFLNCQLKEADFYENNWKQILFKECELSGVGFTGTSLNKIDLSTSNFDQITVDLENLRGAIVNQEQALDFLQLLGLTIKE